MNRYAPACPAEAISDGKGPSTQKMRLMLTCSRCAGGARGKAGKACCRKCSRVNPGVALGLLPMAMLKKKNRTRSTKTIRIRRGHFSSENSWKARAFILGELEIVYVSDISFLLADCRGIFFRRCRDRLKKSPKCRRFLIVWKREQAGRIKN